MHFLSPLRLRNQMKPGVELLFVLSTFCCSARYFAYLCCSEEVPGSTGQRLKRFNGFYNGSPHIDFQTACLICLFVSCFVALFLFSFLFFPFFLQNQTNKKLTKTCRNGLLLSQTLVVLVPSPDQFVRPDFPKERIRTISH